jgi:arylsulfatase A-like enzyme
MNVEPMRLMTPMADVPADQIEKQGIPDEEILLSELLQHSGYRTGICGKWHLGNAEPFRPNMRGFHHQYGFYEAFTLYSEPDAEDIVEHRHNYFANKHIWKQERKGSSAIRMNDSIIDESEYLTFAIARESVRFMEENEDRPFFLVSAFNAPHTPFQVPKEYYELFSDVEDHNKRVYYGMIAALDDAIGMILNASEELDTDRETMVIFASDNGGAYYTGATQNGPLEGGKFTQYEGGINIPMIMKLDGVLPTGVIYEHQVALFDVFSTVLSQSGVQWIQTRKLDGKDLVERVQHPESVSHDYLYWRTEFNKAIRSEKWKLVWNERDDQVFLFDLSKGNEERINVASEYPDIVIDLQKRFLRWEAEMKDPLWPGVMEYRFETNGIETWWAI